MKKLLLFVAIALSINVFGQSSCFSSKDDVMTYVIWKTFESKDGNTRIEFSSSQATLRAGNSTYNYMYDSFSYLGSGYKGLVTMSELSGGGGLKMYVSCKEHMMTDNKGTILYKAGTDDTGGNSSSTPQKKDQRFLLQRTPSEYEVRSSDFRQELTWEEAKKACEDLGDGWQLPSIGQLSREMTIGGLLDEYYWTSSLGQCGSVQAAYGSPSDERFIGVLVMDKSWNKISKQPRKLRLRPVRYVYRYKGNFKSTGTIVIGNLEVQTQDFPEKMNYKYAVNACKSLDGGWRLPSLDEMKLLYKNKDSIGGFTDDLYWTDRSNWDVAKVMNFANANVPDALPQVDRYNVRAVRHVSSNDTSLTVTFGDLVVMTEDLEHAIVPGLISPSRKLMGRGQADQTVRDLGGEWRLPTTCELEFLYQYKDSIGGFVGENYVSSGVRTTGPSYNQKISGWYSVNFHSGKREIDYGSDLSVRAVRGGSNINDSINRINTVKLAEEKRLQKEKKLEKQELKFQQRGLKLISNSFKIGNLEVIPENLQTARFNIADDLTIEESMNWEDAKKACADLGVGWRLPSKDELNILFENWEEHRVKFGKPKTNRPRYWSSAEELKNGDKAAWMKVFEFSGQEILALKDGYAQVLAVNGTIGAETPEEKARRKAKEAAEANAIIEAETAEAKRIAAEKAAEVKRIAAEKAAEAKIIAAEAKIIAAEKAAEVKEAKRPEYEAKIKASTIATMEPENIIDDDGNIWGTLKIVKKQKDEFIIKTGKKVTMVYSGDWKNRPKIIPAIIESIKVINPSLAPQTVENLKILDYKGELGQTIRIKVLY